MRKAWRARGIATLRYQFPYMEKGTGRPDPPRIAHAAVRAAAAEAMRLAPDLPLFAGGRSFGGRMTSQAQAESPLQAVRGLAFLGFPLHPAGKPGIERAEHLARVQIPMLFVSGSRDALAGAGAAWAGRCGPRRARDPPCGRRCRPQPQGAGEKRPDVRGRRGRSAGRDGGLDDPDRLMLLPVPRISNVLRPFVEAASNGPLYVLLATRVGRFARNRRANSP